VTGDTFAVAVSLSTLGRKKEGSFQPLASSHAPGAVAKLAWR